MAAGVRFTKAEREAIRTAFEEFRPVKASWITAKQSVLDKLEKSEMVKPSDKPSGIGWAAAAKAMREVLGPTLAVPSNPSVEWMVKMNNRIRDLGLSLQDCRSIAKVLAAKQWRVYSFEKTIWAADTLLAEAQLEIPQTQPRRAAPLEM